MKAIFRRKSVSEPNSDPSRSKSKSATSPPPLPSSNNNLNGHLVNSKPSNSNTLPRNFTSTSTFQPDSRSTPSPSASTSSRSPTANSSTLPQVSLNRFSGAPLANFNLPLDSLDSNDLSHSHTPSSEAFTTPTSEMPSEIKTASSESPIKSSTSTSESQSNPNPNSINNLPTSATSTTISNPNDSTSTSPPRRSFDPATHPSKGRPDSLGPNSYFGGIGTPVQHTLTQSNTSKKGSQFSELESPQFIPVRVVGSNSSEKVNDERDVNLRKGESNDRSGSRNRDTEGEAKEGRSQSQSRSSSKNRKEKEKEKIPKRPSLNNLQASSYNSERSNQKQEPLPNSSSQSQFQSQPLPQSYSKPKPQSPSNPPKATSYGDKSDAKAKQTNGNGESSELKKSSSGFFSLMRRNTKRKSLVDLKQDGTAGASTSSGSKSKSKTSPIPTSSSTPSLTSKNSPRQQRPPLPQPQTNNINGSNLNSTPYRVEVKNPSTSNPNSNLDSSNDSTDSSQNNSGSVESGNLTSGRGRERSASESRTGSSQGGGPETPLDGTPLIGSMNGFNSQNQNSSPNPIGLNGVNSKNKMKNHPPPRSTTLDESTSSNRNEAEINEKMKAVVQRTSTQVRHQQPILSSLRTDSISNLQEQQQQVHSQTIPKPRTPPNPNPSNPNRPSREAEMEQVRNSVAHSKNSSVDKNGDGENIEAEIEKERDAERPSSRFDMVIDAAAARTSSDANRQLEENGIESNENDEDERETGRDGKGADPSLPSTQSFRQNPKLSESPKIPSSNPKSQTNPNDSNHSWFNYNSKSTLPSSYRSSTNHYRTVQETKRIMVPHRKRVNKRSSSNPNVSQQQKQYEVEWREEIKTELVTYCDLFETVFTRTTEDVLQRLIDGVDPAEIKTLRQTSTSLRFCLDNPKGREIVLRKFLGPLGYRTWTGGRFDKSMKDPLPLSCNDLDAFMIGADLTPEYHLVGASYSQAPQALDPRIPLLARASTRAYNRVLSRLRLQPVFKIPSASQPSTPKQRSPTSSPPTPSGSRLSNGNQLGRVNSYYPQQGQQVPFENPATLSYHGHNLSPMAASPSMPRLSPKNSLQTISPSRSPLSSPGGVSPISISPSHSPNGMLHSLPEESSVPTLPPMPSPWKPGRSALFRVWVPAREALWLSDEELARAEQELFKSGIWNFLLKGDVVWDSALGPLMPGSNVGKLLFDGRYLRDLSYHYDQIGHLPSWINSFLFSPSYFHNIIHSNGSNPVVFLDILPFREQILSSLRLVQDHLETNSPQGRYRIAQWIYRATATITGGQIISNEGLESVDEGWHGKIVIETDGTSEKARSLISRCAGPTADASTRAAILAAVTNGGSMESIARLPKHSTTYDSNGEPIETTSPWCILRERSRPGLIWIRPMEAADRLR